MKSRYLKVVKSDIYIREIRFLRDANSQIMKRLQYCQLKDGS